MDCATVAGRNCRAFRHAKGWAREDLADAAGLSPNSVYNFEAARHSPSLKTVEAIARALGVTSAVLLVDLGSDPESAARRLLATTAEFGKAVCDAFADGKLSAEEREQLLDLRARMEAEESQFDSALAEFGR